MRKGGIIEAFHSKLSCPTCHYPLIFKSALERHLKDAICHRVCRWKNKNGNHVHDWVNVAFLHEAEALLFAQNQFHVDLLYNRTLTNKLKSSKSNVRVQFNCKKAGKPYFCQSGIRIRKAKRFVSESTIAPVYEVIGCVTHNHQELQMEMLPCNADHQHQIFDEIFDTRQQAEEKLKELQGQYTYRKRQCIRDGRTYLTCKRKNGEKKGLCKAHLHLLQWSNKFRIKIGRAHV